MNIKVLGCQPLRRELYALAALSPHEVELDLISPDSPLELIQQKINAELHADYIVLAMGACAAEGLCSNDRPLAIAMVHNCAHLLLGSTERFHRVFSENEDAPFWQMSPPCPKCVPQHGSPCVVAGVPCKMAKRLEPGVREYIAELSLLKNLLNGIWEDDILRVPEHSRIVLDPVDILSAEPMPI